MSSAIQLIASILRLGLYLCRQQDFVPDLIRSGFLWRALQFIQFSMQREMLHYYKEVNPVIDYCCLMLIYILSEAAEKIEDREIAVEGS